MTAKNWQTLPKEEAFWETRRGIQGVEGKTFPKSAEVLFVPLPHEVARRLVGVHRMISEKVGVAGTPSLTALARIFLLFQLEAFENLYAKFS